jgi:hypothetical protein
VASENGLGTVKEYDGLPEERILMLTNPITTLRL